VEAVSEDGMEASFCSCDFDDYPEFFDLKIRKARKEHRCCECSTTIRVGDQYEYVVGKWDGDINDFRTCLICSQIRNDYCAPYGMLREELWERLEIDYLGEWGKEDDEAD
jgi:hypothetical protein